MGETTDSGSWLSNVLSDAITTYGNVATEKARNNPYNYRYGQAGVYPSQAIGGGISPLVLLVGAAVVLVVMLKD